jgi:hypothetical protein
MLGFARRVVVFGFKMAVFGLVTATFPIAMAYQTLEPGERDDFLVTVFLLRAGAASDAGASAASLRSEVSFASTRGSSTWIAARPSLVMRSASAPLPSSRRQTGSEPPAAISSIKPSPRSLRTTLWEAAPFRLGPSLMAWSSRCEAADKSTSWVSVSFIWDLRSVCDGILRRHHRSPALAT